MKKNTEKIAKMTIQELIPHENVLCKFCCDIETLKIHFYKNHRHCMVCEKTFDDNNGIINHLLIKHDQRFRCKFCLYFNFDSNQLNAHMQNCWNEDNIQDLDQMDENQKFDKDSGLKWSSLLC